jgi:nucleoside-diphosphate-sugar epimerase
MRMLIVGGNGFIGRNYITYATQNSTTECYATYRSSDSFVDFAHQHQVIPIQLDLLDAKAISNLPACDTCLFVAGNANHGLSAREAQNEVTALLNFLDWFRGKLIFLSSGAVYYNLKGQISEEQAISPRFPYGVTKFVLEQYVQRHYDIGTLAQFTILRLFYAFGPHERPTRLCRRVIEAIQKGESTFTISAQGQSYLDPLSVQDVAQALNLVIQSDGCDGKILNLCRGEPYFVKDFVTLIAQSLGQPLQLVFDQVTEPLPVDFWGNPEKLAAHTGFHPQPLPDAICTYAQQIASLSF